MEIVLVLLWVVCGVAAGVIASGRNASGCLWFGLGVLLGPIGLALSFTAGSGRKCPQCQSSVHERARKCPKCQSALSVSVASIEAQPRLALVGLLKDDCTGAAEPKYRCPTCKAPAEKDAGYCTGCGQAFRTGLTKRCPDCAEEVKAEARKCRFCGFLFPDLVAAVRPTPEDPYVQEAQERQLSVAPEKAVSGTKFSVIVFVALLAIVVSSVVAIALRPGSGDSIPAGGPVTLKEQSSAYGLAIDAIYGLAIDAIVRTHPGYDLGNFEPWSVATVVTSGNTYSFGVIYREGPNKWKRFRCQVEGKTATCKEQ